MAVNEKRYKIRPLRDSDALQIWNWFLDEGWHGFGWTTWTLCRQVPTCRQWVTVNEHDRPISYIAISEHWWGQCVAGYISARKYRNQGVGSRLWHETVDKMEKENIGLTATSQMITKYVTRSKLRHISPVEIIRFKGRVTFLDTLKTLPKGLFNPDFKVYPIQDDRTIEKVVDYDRRTFANPKRDKAREDFLWIWLRKGRATVWDPAPKILSLYAENKLGVVVGYGSISPAIGSAKIAPLYADDEVIARTLITELLKFYNSTVTPIDQIVLNVPNTKDEFIEFLKEVGLVVSLTLKQAFKKVIPTANYKSIYCTASHFCQLY